jgi:WD40 repeat protein
MVLGRRVTWTSEDRPQVANYKPVTLSVGWAPDGTPVQLVAGTNCCILREARTGREIQAFRFPARHVVVGENGPVLGMLPDGSRVAAVVSNGADSSVVAWETATRAVLSEASGTASSLAFSPDGGCLACGGLEGEITVRSLPGLQPTQVLRTRVWRAPVLALAFTADPLIPYEATAQTNRWLLASGNRSGAIAIWDVSAGQPPAWCRGSPYGVFSLAVHPDGLTLASAGRSEARLWDMTTSQLLLRLPVPDGDAARALAFSSDGSRLAWGNEPGFQPASAGVWSLAENRGVRVLRGLGADVRQLWFSPDSRLLAALDDNWHAAVWAVDTGRLVRLFEAPLGMVADNAGGAFDATGTRFAFATWQEARLYDLRSGTVLDRWTLPEGFADSLRSTQADVSCCYGERRGRGSPASDAGGCAS